MFLDIINGEEMAEEDIQKVEECLKAAWDALPNSLFEGLIKSMKARIDMCILAKGWHTKYQKLDFGQESQKDLRYSINSSFHLIIQ